jgi:hypothetical protein
VKKKLGNIVYFAKLTLCLYPRFAQYSSVCDFRCSESEKMYADMEYLVFVSVQD